MTATRKPAAGPAWSTIDPAVVEEAARRGIGLHPMSEYCVATAPDSLVFGYAAHPEPTLRRAIATIADLLPG